MRYLSRQVRCNKFTNHQNGGAFMTLTIELPETDEAT